MSEQEPVTIRRVDYEELLGMIESLEDELEEVREQLRKLKEEMR